MIAHAWSPVQNKGARPNRTARHLSDERSEQIVKKSKTNAVKRRMPLRGIGVETNLLFATGLFKLPSAMMKRLWLLPLRVVWMYAWTFSLSKLL